MASKHIKCKLSILYKIALSIFNLLIVSGWFYVTRISHWRSFVSIFGPIKRQAFHLTRIILKKKNSVPVEGFQWSGRSSRVAFQFLGFFFGFDCIWCFPMSNICLPLFFFVRWLICVIIPGNSATRSAETFFLPSYKPIQVHFLSCCPVLRKWSLNWARYVSLYIHSELFVWCWKEIVTFLENYVNRCLPVWIFRI